LSSILDKIEALNSERFTYENYESNWWSLLDIDYAEGAMDKEDNQEILDTVIADLKGLLKELKK
jgi:hypothetical protein